MGNRRRNERQYGKWVSLPNKGRRYWYELKGKQGWKARYIKEVDAGEETVRFYQEIYNENGRLREIHEKFPIDTGHREI